MIFYGGRILVLFFITFQDTMAVTVIFVYLAIVSAVTATNITIQNHWQSGFNVFIAVPITQELTSWRLHLVFDHDVNTIMVSITEQSMEGETLISLLPPQI